MKPSLAMIRVVAANKSLIDALGGVENDFTDEYSRELHIEIPIGYRRKGCIVYGAGWINPDNIDNKDIHFFYDKGTPIRTTYGFQLCVGTPESFSMMKNVILENVRTAENMLIAYERVMIGVSDQVELIAYAHGEKGREQFMNNKKRYITKR